MKVACIGNMNNMMFCVTRYLRDFNIDTELLLLPHEFKHFLPHADSYKSNWQTYTRRLLPDPSKNFTSAAPEEIALELAPFDKIIATNLGPAFIHKAKRRTDIYCPHGSDYYEIPFQKQPNGMLSEVSLAQRNGIKSCNYYFTAPYTNPTREKYWSKLDIIGERIYFPCPLIYLPEYDDKTIKKHAQTIPVFDKCIELKKQSSFLIFHHSRQCWSSSHLANDHKGNDIFFKGIKMFSDSVNIKPAIIALEYGPDLLASKQLVRDLKLESIVHWFPKMERKDLLAIMYIADLVAIQFKDSWTVGGALYESLALNKPILSRRDDSLYLEPLYPNLSAGTPQEIAARLAEYSVNPSSIIEKSNSGRQWLKINRLKPAIDKMIQILSS